MHTLRAKLIFLLVISALSPLLIYGGLSLYGFQLALMQNIEKSYSEISARMAEEINFFLTGSKNLLETLSQDLSETDLTEQQTERIVENYVIRFPQFLKIVLYNEERQLVLKTSLKSSDKDLPSYDLLSSVIEEKGFVASKPYLSEELSPVLWFLIPMKSKSGDTTILAAHVDLLQMWRWISKTELGQDAYISVVSKNNEVVASGDPFFKQKMLSSNRPVYFGEFDLRSFSQKKTQIIETHHGQSLISVKSIVENPPWYLILAQPTSVSFKPIKDITYILVALTVFFLLLMILTALIGSKKLLLKPVRKLTLATKEIGQGNLDYKIVDLGQDELGQLGESINKMSHDLKVFQEVTRRQERLAMFGRMASGLAHDLKHPVKNIENAAKVMETMYEDESYRKTFTSIVTREFARINQFLEDLRNLTHDMKFNPLPTMLENLIEEIIESFKLECEKRNIQLIFESEENFPPLFVDPYLLRRVIENLLSNAIQAIHDPLGEVRLLLKKEDDYILLQISDNGLGIPEERITGLFDEFTTTKRKGLGLGLAIVKKIISLHNGKIDVKSSVGKGTSFSIYLPYKIG